jgi:uncharacterized protein YdiU (UPF0061 family)
VYGSAHAPQAYDKELAIDFLRLMAAEEADYTNTYRALSDVPALPEESETSGVSSSSSAPSSMSSGGGEGEAGGEGSTPRLPSALAAVLPEAVLGSPERVAAWQEWLDRWRVRLVDAWGRDEEAHAQRRKLQKLASPKYVPRQHLLQVAIEAAEAGDYSELDALMKVLQDPYAVGPSDRTRLSNQGDGTQDVGGGPSGFADHSGRDVGDKYCQPPPEDMRDRPGVCRLSCSS